MSILKSHWIQIPWWSVRKALRIASVVLVGAVFIGVIAFTMYMKSLPSLSLWHTTILQNEFTADSDVKDFDGYVALENMSLLPPT